MREIESLREEYIRESQLFGKRGILLLLRRRIHLRRSKSRRSDVAALLKEKDEIIIKVMAKDREPEEEKKGLIPKLQVIDLSSECMVCVAPIICKDFIFLCISTLIFTGEENKVDASRGTKQKTATENCCKKHRKATQTRTSSTKRVRYQLPLTVAKEPKLLAEHVQTSDTRTELKVASLEKPMLRRGHQDLQSSYSYASERRCEELITQGPRVYKATLRQIEAMQETTAKKGRSVGKQKRKAAAAERQRTICK
ncbi:Golgin candidate 5, partial [Cucurbita argyrosperma subsp. argyrosperma]